MDNASCVLQNRRLRYRASLPKAIATAQLIPLSPPITSAILSPNLPLPRCFSSYAFGCGFIYIRGRAVVLVLNQLEFFSLVDTNKIVFASTMDGFPQANSVSWLNLNSEAYNQSKYLRRVVKRRLTIGYATEMQDATSKSIGRVAAGMPPLFNFFTPRSHWRV